MKIKDVIIAVLLSNNAYKHFLKFDNNSFIAFLCNKLTVYNIENKASLPCKPRQIQTILSAEVYAISGLKSGFIECLNELLGFDIAEKAKELDKTTLVA